MINQILFNKMLKFNLPLLKAIRALGQNATSIEITRKLGKELAKPVSIGQVSRVASSYVEQDILSARTLKPEGRKRSILIYELTPKGLKFMAEIQKFETDAAVSSDLATS